MALTWNIEDILLQLETMGFFYYVVPFLIIFAIVYAILEKSNWLGENKPVQVIVSMGVGLLSIQFGLVQDFFNNIFPKMGVGLAILLVFLIIMGFFVKADDKKTSFKGIGFTIAGAVLIWTLMDWGLFGGGYGYNNFWWVLEDNLPGIVFVGLLIWGVVAVAKGKDNS